MQETNIESGYGTLVYAGIIIVAILALGMILTRLYRRAPKDAALIRTGFGGEKVILNGGVMVLPVLHDLMHVSLNTVKLNVSRAAKDSLITLDKIRVDVVALFHIRVSPKAEAISIAAQTLGKRINEEGAVKELVEGKLISALRSAAATMTMDDLHANRADFIQKVQQLLVQDLATNGLELETVSLTHFDQTSIEHLNENNAFDAEGLTAITRTIEERKKVRNEIQAENRVAIEQRNYEAEQQSLTISQQSEFARLEQEKAVQTQRAQTEAAIAAETAAREQEAEAARISAKRATDTANIEAERAVREAEIAREQAVELARQQQSIAVAEKSRDESVARAEADKARAAAVTAQEAVKTAQETAVAERAKNIAVIEARQNAERQAVSITVAAEAEKQAAADRAEAARQAAEGEANAIRIRAQGEAEAERLRAEAAEVTNRVTAEGQRALIEAKNQQSEASMAFDQRTALVAAMPSIIAETVKPIQQIDSIKVVDIGGLNSGGTANDNGSVGAVAGGGDNLAAQAVQAALKYRMNAPILTQIVQEAFGENVDLGNIQSLVSAAAPTPTVTTVAPVAASPKAVEAQPVEASTGMGDVLEEQLAPRRRRDRRDDDERRSSAN